MKRLLLVFVVTILLSACQSSDISVNEEGAHKTEIEFWYGLTGVQGDFMESFIEDFNNTQDEIVVKGVSQESYEITAKALQAAIVKRNPPSVVLLEDNQMHKIGNKGGLMSLDRFIELSETFNSSDFITPFLSQGRFNGNTYALPLYGTTQVLYYRKDMFEEHGIDPDTLRTWEGLAEAARKLTVRNGEEVLIYGWEPIQGREDLIDASINRGGKFVSDDGKTVLIAEDPWVETWEQFRVWINEDKIMRVHYGGEGWQYWYATIDDVLQGRAAGYIGSSGDRGDLDFDILGAHLRPYWEGYAHNPTGVVNAHTICVPAQTSEEKAMAAFKFIEYMTSTDVSASWSMETGYLPVRESSLKSKQYQEFVRKHPEFKVTSQQIISSRQIFEDPTGGKIYDALKVAAEKVQIQNIPAEIALEEARAECQAILDKVLMEAKR